MTISRLAKLCSLTFRMSVSANQMYCLHACLAYFVAVFYSFTSAEAVTCFWYCGLWFVSWSSPEVCLKNSYFELRPLVGHHTSASQHALLQWPVMMTLMSLSIMLFVRLYIVKCWYLDNNTTWRYACCCCCYVYIYINQILFILQPCSWIKWQWHTSRPIHSIKCQYAIQIRDKILNSTHWKFRKAYNNKNSSGDEIANM